VGDSTEPITMDDIELVLTASAAKVLTILDELVHTRATFPESEDDADDGAEGTA
jgi:5'-methylthioadenosine phosphorylase